MSGPDCCNNPPEPDPDAPSESGNVLQIVSLNCYISGDPGSEIGVILVSDVYATDWNKYHAPKQAVEFAKPVIKALLEKGISKIGAAGFCWGAKIVVELAKDAYIQTAALLHTTFVTLDDIKGVNVPVAVLGDEYDRISPPEVIKQFEAALQAKPEVDHFVKAYPDVAHGWNIRYKDQDTTAVKCAEEAHQDLVDCFDTSDNPFGLVKPES